MSKIISPSRLTFFCLKIRRTRFQIGVALDCFPNFHENSHFGSWGTHFKRCGIIPGKCIMKKIYNFNAHLDILYISY